MANEGEYKERFKYLFNQIQNLKTYDMKEYINSIKEDYHIYRGEIQGLLHVKDKEERINHFVNNLSIQREKNIVSRNKIQNTFNIKDGTFETSIINIVDKKKK